MSSRPPFIGEVAPEPLLGDPEARHLLAWTANELRVVNTLLERLQSGFGGLAQSGYAPPVYTTAGNWETVEFDAQQPASDYRTIASVAGNAITLLESGVCELSWDLALDHNSTNDGRTLDLRPLGDGAPLSVGSTYGIGRNQDTTNIVGGLLLDTGTLMPGMVLQLQLGNAQGANVVGSNLRGVWYVKELAAL